MYHGKRECRGMAKVGKLSDATRAPPPANGELLVQKHTLRGIAVCAQLQRADT